MAKEILDTLNMLALMDHSPDIFDAVEANDVQLLDALIKFGADVNESREGWTPLHAAA